MILQHSPPLHLTYCLNVHPGEAWGECFDAIREKALAVKQRVAPDQYFGLGLRLSQFGAAQLAGDSALIEEARDFFAREQMYPFTVNAFPYGRFHSGPVKEKVYAPDWRTPERRDYTMLVADVLTNFLPPGVDGSISTVPGTFKPWIDDDNDRFVMARNLAAVVAYLAAIYDDTGQEMHLGLEPEPDCFLETTAETIEFFRECMFTVGVEEVARIMGCTRAQAELSIHTHLGVCLDTCHVAMQFEDPLEALQAYRQEGIRLSKVQLSAAIDAPGGRETWTALKRFSEPVYLHQVKATTKAGAQLAWYDLPTAIEEGPGFPEINAARVHFHVPLFFQGAKPLGTTVTTISPDFFHALRQGACSHLEIETYTFDVLPDELRGDDVVKSIAREYSWVLNQLQ